MPNQNEIYRVGVIMAGGSGERFWPLSRQRRPKQLLRLTSEEHTMLGEAVNRISPLIAPEHVYVITARTLVEPIRRARVGIPNHNVVGEPAKRNTSGALAYIAAHLMATYDSDGSNITMAVMTADHLIGDEEGFRRTVLTAMEAAERGHALATLGVVPTRPETGYGYIHVPKDLKALAGSPEDVPVYAVTGFREKPNLERAEEFLASGNYFWNSGMFFWRVADFMAELDHAQPDLCHAVIEMTQALRNNDQDLADAIFHQLEDISIDYALMERAKRAVVARASFDWDDVGAWTALDRTYPHDEKGNVILGEPVVINSEGCIVYNDAGSDAIAVGVIGLEDVVVVVTQDAVLVMKKDDAQDVKKVVQELKKRNARQT
ncbi:MAG: sugar phosphate nucleotidyltransferase [Rhodospirillales bacterium]|jgi:mannose-1-phosphate guanylyltransferase|nr:sugar phosphate nucleotidyltransferase [Rhodospirillales bacterium]